MQRRLVIAVLLLFGLVPVARADEGAIAVLPLTSSEKRLAMYGAPVARVLAGHLRQGGATVEAVTSSRGLPKRVAWVIDGRIVAASGGRVVLEARLRDPGRGRAVGQVASKPGRLTEIDELARQVAGDLGPLLARAAAARSSAPAITPQPAPASVPSPAPRPAIIITRDREPVVTDALASLVERLGYRAVVSDLTGIAPPDKVKGAMGKVSARLALLAEVKKVDYEWAAKDVLTARGSMRLVLVDAAGKPLYNAIVDTDTLVGSRGDRHGALLGFVARQVMQMAAPRLKKALAR